MCITLPETRQHVACLMMDSMLLQQIGHQAAHLVHCKAASGSFGAAEPKPIGHTAPDLSEAVSWTALLPKPYGQVGLAEDCDTLASECSEAKSA